MSSDHSSKAGSYDVAIIGAGIAGLAAARALINRGYSVRVFEQAKQLSAPIGGALILLPSGVSALRAMHLGSIVDALKININFASNHAADGSLLLTGSLEVEQFYKKAGEHMHTFVRFDLQEKLLQALPPDTVVFGHTCDSIEESSAHVRIHFKNGATVEAQYLCGADGIKSKVRAYLSPNNQPQYTGICVFGGVLKKEYAVNLEPEFNIKPDQVFFHYGENRSLWLSPVCDNRQSWYICRRMPLDEFITGEDKLSQLKTFVFPWSKIAEKVIKNIFSQGQNAHNFAVPAYEISLQGSWISQNQRIVLIGDAAHGFGPTAGLATSLALMDAYFFAECLYYHALPLYEKMRKPAARTFCNMEKAYQKIVFTDDENIIEKRNQEVYAANSISILWKNLSDAMEASSLDKHHAALKLKNQA